MNFYERKDNMNYATHAIGSDNLLCGTATLLWNLQHHYIGSDTSNIATTDHLAVKLDTDRCVTFWHGKTIHYTVVWPKRFLATRSYRKRLAVKWSGI